MAENMISITESARQHIQAFLQDKPETCGFRMAVKTTGCSGYSYIADIAEAQPTDLRLTIDGIPVFIAESSVPIIKNTVIDFIAKGSGQKQLTFQNPNAGALCGCGESFTLKKEGEE